MWNIGIGAIELALVLPMIPGVVFFRGARRRWYGVVLVVMALGIVLTPADPVSTVLVALPLLIAFTLGVLAAPLFRPVDGIAER